MPRRVQRGDLGLDRFPVRMGEENLLERRALLRPTAEFEDGLQGPCRRLGGALAPGRYALRIAPGSANPCPLPFDGGGAGSAGNTPSGSSEKGGAGSSTCTALASTISPTPAAAGKPSVKLTAGASLRMLRSGRMVSSNLPIVSIEARMVLSSVDLLRLRSRGRCKRPRQPR